MILPTDAGVIVIGLGLEDPEPCELCGGSGIASFPDPFFDGDLLDSVCPCGASEAQR